MSDVPNPTVVENPGTLAPDQRWPQVPAIDGAVYGFIDPAHGTEMVGMSLATWRSIIQDITVMKQRMDQLTMENIEMKQGRHPEGPRILLPN